MAPCHALALLAALAVPGAASAARLAWAPDGKLLVAVTRDGSILVLAPSTGAEIRRLQVPGGRAECLAMSPAGDRLAAGTFDGTVEVWAMPPEKAARSVKAGGPVHGLAFTPDGKTIVGALGAELLAWDAATGEGARTIVKGLAGASDVAISPDGRTVASGLSDGSVRIWDLGSGSQIRKLEGPGQALRPVAFSPDGSMLVAGTGVALGVWDVATGRSAGILGGPLGIGYSLAFPRDGKLLATGGCGSMAGCSSRGVQLWRMPEGDAVRSLSGLTDTVRGIAFSPKGGELAAVAEKVVIWDVASGRLLHTMPAGGK